MHRHTCRTEYELEVVSDDRPPEVIWRTLQDAAALHQGLEAAIDSGGCDSVDVTVVDAAREALGLRLKAAEDAQSASGPEQWVQRCNPHHKSDSRGCI